MAARVVSTQTTTIIGITTFLVGVFVGFACAYIQFKLNRVVEVARLTDEAVERRIGMGSDEELKANADKFFRLYRQNKATERDLNEKTRLLTSPPFGALTNCRIVAQLNGMGGFRSDYIAFAETSEEIRDCFVDCKNFTAYRYDDHHLVIAIDTRYARTLEPDKF